MTIENLKEDLAKAFLLAVEATGQVLKPEEAVVQQRPYAINFDLINTLLRNFWTADFLEDLTSVHSGISVPINFLTDMHQRFEIMVMTREMLERLNGLNANARAYASPEEVELPNISLKLQELCVMHYEQSFGQQVVDLTEGTPGRRSMFEYRQSMKAQSVDFKSYLKGSPWLSTLYLFCALGVWWEIKNGFTK